MKQLIFVLPFEEMLLKGIFLKFKIVENESEL